MKAAVLGLQIPPSPPLTPACNPSNNIFRLPSSFLPLKSLNYSLSFHHKTQPRGNNFLRFLVFASENNNESNGDKLDDTLSNGEDNQRRNGEKGSNGKGEGINGNGNGIGGEKGNGNGRPRLNLKWVDLLIDPDPDNVVAVGLTGVLAWASVQVLWQLFAISIAILLAALKYSFIAALLVFILITLL